MLFTDNKYKTWYFEIINRRQIRKPIGYSELHHIVPKSIGGTDSNNNLVHLTAKEHFICHRLLTKITIGTDRAKMIYTVMLMAANNRLKHRVTARTYETIKTEFSIVCSDRMKTNNPSKRIEVKLKMRMAKLGKPLSEASLKKREETRKKRIESGQITYKKGRVQPIEEKNKRAASLKGHVVSENTRRLIGDANRGSNNGNFGATPQSFSWTKYYLIIFPDGATEEYCGQLAICNKYGLSKKIIWNMIKNHSTRKTGALMGAFIELANSKRKSA